MFRSLRFKLVLSMLALVALTIAIISISVLVNQNKVSKQQIESELVSIGKMMATNIVAPLVFADQSAADQVLGALKARPDIRAATVYGMHGEVFASYPHSAASEAGAAAYRKPLGQVSSSQLYLDDDGLHALTPIINDGDIVGVLALTDSMAAYKRRVSSLYQWVAITSVAAFLVSLAVMVWLQHLFTKPLSQILEVIRGITVNKDFSLKVPESATSEFNILGQSLNAMVSEISERDRQLANVNAELEQRVQSRTQDLETALQLANEGSRAKSAFLAVMSHEVRTPLNGVIGFSELLKIKKLDDDTAQTVTRLNESACSLLHLLNEILDFSKLDAQKVTIEPIEFDLAELVEPIAESALNLAARKGLKFELSITDAAKGVYLGDEVRIKQVVQNYIANAIKFTETGKITMAIDAQHRDSAKSIIFSIADTGPGIEPARLKDIFNPFVQADSSITRKYGGTGLGLAICKQLIDLMDGRHGVKSELGKGSVFWFDLSLTQVRAAAEPERKSASQSASHRPGHILIVEDNEINQLVIQRLLMSFGHSCELAATGDEAIEKVLSHKFDLIFMDYHMPAMDGAEATKRIRALSAASSKEQTPIIALTADIQPSVTNLFFDAGASGALLKPFTRENLGNCLNKWLSGEAGSDAEAASLPAASELLVKPNVLRDLIALSPEDGPALARQLISMFDQSTPARIETIDQAVRQGDYEALFMAAHALKSSAQNIGADQLSGIAKELEQLAREQQWEKLTALLDLLRKSYRETKVVLSVLERSY
jgi:two-component system, sensor histidine kinase